MKRTAGITTGRPPLAPPINDALASSLAGSSLGPSFHWAHHPANRLDTHNLLAAIVEQSNDAIFSRKLDGTITTWNAAATRIFGFRAGEIIGCSCRAIIPQGHRDEFRRLVSRIRQGQAVQHFETKRIRKDGSSIHVSLTLSPIRDASGRLKGFSTIARDITEQRQVREALERREQELTDLFEEASVGLLLTSCQGLILRTNPALLETLECKPEDCVGHALAGFHPDHVTLADLLKRLSKRETLRNFETLLRSCGGRFKEVLVDASAFWVHGKVAHLRWFIRDITRRKQLEREILSTTERERRSFSRELHDSLGQQLSGIAYLSNVVRDRLGAQGLPEAAEVARISKLLKQAIEETRRVSRGLSPIRPEPEGLTAALNELAAHTSSVFGMTCRFYCPKTVMVADSESATHLYRIAQEAVNNAIRHGQAQRVIIRMNLARSHLHLSIVDNGKGIKPLSPKRTGLGLRVMHYRAGLLQGTILVQRRRAVGTEVRCVLPAARLKASVQPRRKAQ